MQLIYVCQNTSPKSQTCNICAHLTWVVKLLRGSRSCLLKILHVHVMVVEL
uniref:Uncharacterized protein n=1 Tax=Helianthus annuus TaxID=4232 RepID=A0A251TMP0_HELAN